MAKQEKEALEALAKEITGLKTALLRDLERLPADVSGQALLYAAAETWVRSRKCTPAGDREPVETLRLALARLRRDMPMPSFAATLPGRVAVELWRTRTKFPGEHIVRARPAEVQKRLGLAPADFWAAVHTLGGITGAMRVGSSMVGRP